MFSALARAASERKEPVGRLECRGCARILRSALSMASLRANGSSFRRISRSRLLAAGSTAPLCGSQSQGACGRSAATATIALWTDAGFPSRATPPMLSWPSWQRKRAIPKCSLGLTKTCLSAATPRRSPPGRPTWRLAPRGCRISSGLCREPPAACSESRGHHQLVRPLGSGRLRLLRRKRLVFLARPARPEDLHVHARGSDRVIGLPGGLGQAIGAQ